MKRAVIVCGTGVCLLVGAVCLLGMNVEVDDEAERTIQANGTATVYATPDSVRLFLEVTTTGKTATDARRKNADRVKAIRSALLKLKLANLKTKTRDVTVAKLFGKAKDEHTPAPVVGYRVEHEFSVLFEEADVKKLNQAAGQILDTALENGAESNRRRVTFFRKYTTDLERQAMTKAVENAIENARAFAKGAKVTVKRVLVIHGGDVGTTPSYFAGQQGQFGGLRTGASTSFQAGNAPITCDVRVTCAF